MARPKKILQENEKQNAPAKKSPDFLKVVWSYGKNEQEIEKGEISFFAYPTAFRAFKAKVKDMDTLAKITGCQVAVYLVYNN